MLLYLDGAKLKQYLYLETRRRGLVYEYNNNYVFTHT